MLAVAYAVYVFRKNKNSELFSVSYSLCTDEKHPLRFVGHNDYVLL